MNNKCCFHTGQEGSLSGLKRMTIMYECQCTASTFTRSTAGDSAQLVTGHSQKMGHSLLFIVNGIQCCSLASTAEPQRLRGSTAALHIKSQGPRKAEVQRLFLLCATDLLQHKYWTARMQDQSRRDCPSTCATLKKMSPNKLVCIWETNCVTGNDLLPSVQHRHCM